MNPSKKPMNKFMGEVTDIVTKITLENIKKDKRLLDRLSKN